VTLEELAYLSQIVGLVAILGSLIAIYFQMRQNHAIERGNAQRDILNQTREWWMQCVEDEEMFETIAAGLHDFNALDRYRQARFNAVLFSLQHIVEGVFFQHRSKLINVTSHDGYMIAYLALMNTPGGRQWWASASKVGNAELCSYLTKRLIAESATLPMWNDLLPYFKPPSVQPGKPA
jgi:hypothetical protein